MIAIVDYGVGNLFSLAHSIEYIGQSCVVTRDPAQIEDCERIIFPGVGAFGDAAAKLRASGLDTVVRQEAERGKLLLGICVGMQLLLEKSYEYGEHAGLGLITGQVRPIPNPAGLLKIPQIGWNSLRFPAGQDKHPLFRYTEPGNHVYFVHSYYGAGCGDAVIAETEYGNWLTAAVARDNICGVQFHPEKSGAVGLNILRAFCEM